MKDNCLTVTEIKELMDSMSHNHLSSLKIKQGDFMLVLEGAKTEQVLVQQSTTQQTTQTPAQAPQPQHRGQVITSPIVGTFYAAPAPDKSPYVHVGSAVKKGDVLFIIESMKLMNEVTSELDGTVTEIIAKDAQGVEYGQPILYIE